jgi:hypothetical protein
LVASGTLVSPTISGSVGTGWACTLGAAALVQSHAEPVREIPATATFAATAIQRRRALIIGV